MRFIHDEIMTDDLKRRIINKAIKLGCDPYSAFIRYDGRLYHVNIIAEKVTPQLEYK